MVPLRRRSLHGHLLILLYLKGFEKESLILHITFVTYKTLEIQLITYANKMRYPGNYHNQVLNAHC